MYNGTDDKPHSLPFTVLSALWFILTFRRVIIIYLPTIPIDNNYLPVIGIVESKLEQS